MSKKIWGNITWRLFHTMTLTINDSNHDIQNALDCIKRICKNLPCPICSNEASILLKKYNTQTIQTKEEFKKFIYVFHNNVNSRVNNPSILYEHLEKVHTMSLNAVLNEFFKVYSSIKSSSHMMMYNFHRNLVIDNTRKYFISNQSSYRFY